MFFVISTAAIFCAASITAVHQSFHLWFPGARQDHDSLLCCSMLFWWHQPLLSLCFFHWSRRGAVVGSKEKHRDVSCGDPECLHPVLSPRAGLIEAVNSSCLPKLSRAFCMIFLKSQFGQILWQWQSLDHLILWKKTPMIETSHHSHGQAHKTFLNRVHGKPWMPAFQLERLCYGLILVDPYQLSYLPRPVSWLLSHLSDDFPTGGFNHRGLQTFLGTSIADRYQRSQEISCQR